MNSAFPPPLSVTTFAANTTSAAGGATSGAASRIGPHAGPAVFPPPDMRPTVRPHASPRALGKQLKQVLRAGNPFATEQALLAGADPNRRLRNSWGEQGRSPMQRAIEEGVSPQLLQLLLNHGGNPSLKVGGVKLLGIGGDTLLHRAVRFRNVDGLKMLIKPETVQTPNHSGKYAYELAWERLVAAPYDTTALEMVRLLTPPHHLVPKMNWRQGYVPDAVLRALIPELPPYYVRQMNNASVVAALPHMTSAHLQALSADQLLPGDTPMHRAIRFGDLNGLQALFNAGAVHTRNYSGKYPYQLAWERLVTAPHDPTTLEMVALLTPPNQLVSKMNEGQEFVPDAVLRALIPRLPTVSVLRMNPASVAAALPLMNNASIAAALPLMNSACLAAALPHMTPALLQAISPNQLYALELRQSENMTLEPTALNPPPYSPQ